ncbi:MAG: ATP-binding protein [Anaerolineae bacterium]
MVSQRKDLPHIFERFYRGDDHRPTVSGMGLGLTIASKIVEKHGGQLGVESEVGKGTTFRIILPAVRPGTDLQITADLASR